MDEKAKRSGDNDASMRMVALGSHFAVDGGTVAVEPSPAVEPLYPQQNSRSLMFTNPPPGVRLAETMVPSNEDSTDAVDLGRDAYPAIPLRNLQQGKGTLAVQALRPQSVVATELLGSNPVMYEELSGILGDSRSAFGALSDVSVAASNSEKAEPSCRTCSSGLASMPHDSFAIPGDPPGPRVKLMCSFGGKILPRPSDGKLRYVGGETRIVSVNRHISYADLMLKLTDSYGQSPSLKYQLPDEDLDALISVSSDEDLENMMEEFDRLDAGEGSSKLRVFLFSAADYDTGHLSDTGDRRNSEQRYVDAVNGMGDIGLRKPTDISSSSYNLIGLDLSQAWNPSRVPSVSVAFPASPIISDTLVQSMPIGVPVPPKQGLPKTSSAPSCTPSSPPILAQPSRDNHQYVTLKAELTNQDLEVAGSASSSAASHHDLHSQFPDNGKHPDFSNKPQQDKKIKPQYDQDHAYQAEHWHATDPGMSRVDSRGLLKADAGGRMVRIESHGRMGRVESYGKLLRSQEQQMELATHLAATDGKLEEPLPDMLAPQVDLHCGHVQQQQLPQIIQAPWQQQSERHLDSYSMVDILQHTGPDSGNIQRQALQQHQQASHVYAPPAHEATLYRHMNEQQHQEEILGGRLPSKSSSSGTIFQIGSAPSSPRMGFMENIGKQIGGQQHMQVYPAFNGGLVEQDHGRMLYHQNDQASRAFQPSNLAPVFLEQAIAVKEELPCQPPFVNPESIQVFNSVHAKYEPIQVLNHHSHVVTRPIINPYSDVNPYHEGLGYFPDGPESAENQILSQGQQLFSVSNSNLSQDFMQHEGQFLVHHYKDMQDYVTWDLQQRESDFDEAKGHMGMQTWMAQMDSKEVGTNAKSVLSSYIETPPVNFPTSYLPEESTYFLDLAANDPYTTVQHVNAQFDPIGSSPLHLRAVLFPTSIAGAAIDRVGSSDALQAAPLRGRPELDRLRVQMTSTMILDAKMPLKDVSLPVLASNGSTNLPVGQRSMAEKPPGVVSSQAVLQMPLLTPSTGPNTSESLFSANIIEEEWNGDFDLSPVRSEVPSHDTVRRGQLNEEAFEHKLGLPGNVNMMNLGEKMVDVVTLPAPHSTSSQNLIHDDTVVPPYSVHHTQDVNLSTSISYPAVLATLATGLDSLTPSVLATTAVASPVTSFVTEAVSTCSGLASLAPGLGLVSSLNVPEKLENKDFFSAFMLPSSREQSDCGKNQADVLAQVCIHNSEDKEKRGNLEHATENITAAIIKPTLYSSPTLSIQNWEKSLAQSEFEQQEQVAAEILSEEKISEEAKLDAIREREVTFEETKLGIEEDDIPDSKVNQPSNAGAIAEAEAIARGLQTIKNADLEELRELGSGTFGTVYHGKWRGTDVAIKRIKSSCFTGRPYERERLIADFWQEACILSQLHHPNVVAFYGVVPDGPGGTLATVTEYMVNGSLKQVLQRKDRTIDRRKRVLIAMDAAFGMEYLHGKNIVHFDLKCENLLVNMRDPQRPICKVGDLGLSKVKHQTLVSGGVRGTLPWMAPELLNGSSSLVSEKVDVFSFAIVMWELLTGDEPYANMHYGAIIGGIVNNTLRPPIPDWCDPAWRSLMECCWSAEPSERPAFPDITRQLRAMAASLHARGQTPIHATGQIQV